jgi:hypothetical protein
LETKLATTPAFQKIKATQRPINCIKLTFYPPFALSPSSFSIVALRHLCPGLKASLSAVYLYASPSSSVLMTSKTHKYNIS